MRTYRYKTKGQRPRVFQYVRVIHTGSQSKDMAFALQSLRDLKERGIKGAYIQDIPKPAATHFSPWRYSHKEVYYLPIKGNQYRKKPAGFVKHTIKEAPSWVLGTKPKPGTYWKRTLRQVK